MVYFGFVVKGVNPYGLVDPNDTFYSSELLALNKSPAGYRYGIYFDDTDDRRIPALATACSVRAKICTLPGAKPPPTIRMTST